MVVSMVVSFWYGRYGSTGYCCESVKGMVCLVVISVVPIMSIHLDYYCFRSQSGFSYQSLLIFSVLMTIKVFFIILIILFLLFIPSL